jgi:hypothetical protein
MSCGGLNIQEVYFSNNKIRPYNQGVSRLIPWSFNLHCTAYLGVHAVVSSGLWSYATIPQASAYSAAKYTAIKSALNNKCLDVPGGVPGNGVRVQMWTCNKFTAQRWNFNSDMSITYANTGYCLDTWPYDNGTPIYLWPCHGGRRVQVYWTVGKSMLGWQMLGAMREVNMWTKA